MADVKFRIATGKHERGRPLAEGRVQVPGLELQSQMFKNNAERHDRFLNGEFDAAEFSMALYLRMWAQGADFAALPVFLNRQFRHGAIFVNAKSGIREPRDLAGKKIAVNSWFNTAALWARGVLEHEHGLDVKSIEWLTGEASEVGDASLPPGVKLKAAEPTTLTKKLIAGEIDALITPRTPARNYAEIIRLFPDFKSAEEDYYRKTGVYPMSHAFVVRTKHLETYPWLAQSLFVACEHARKIAAEYADDPEHSLLAWYGADAERERQILGLNADANGIDQNRRALEKLLVYAHSSGVIPRLPAVEEVFHPSALVPVGAGV
jgi:4,5-dihydroxyphthalate decarboxylase